MSKEIKKEMYEILDKSQRFKKYSGPTRLAIVELMLKAFDKGYDAANKNRAT